MSNGTKPIEEIVRDQALLELGIELENHSLESADNMSKLTDEELIRYALDRSEITQPGKLGTHTYVNKLALKEIAGRLLYSKTAEKHYQAKIKSLDEQIELLHTLSIAQKDEMESLRKDKDKIEQTNQELLCLNTTYWGAITELLEKRRKKHWFSKKQK